MESQILSQSYQYRIESYNVFIQTQGFPPSLLNGYGNSGLFNDVANIGSVNPAALENFNKKAAGISYQFGTNLNNPFVTNVTYERINQIVPQSFGIVYPIDDLKIGLSMHQKYNTSTLFGPIPITTINNPDGTGDFYSPLYKSTVYNYSITASYTLPVLFKNSFLSVGLRLGLDNLKEYDTFNITAIIDETVNSSDFAVGVMYTIKEEETNYLQFGLSFESELKFNKITSWNLGGTIPEPTANGTQYITDNSTPIELIATFPSTLRFDFDISTNSKIKILGSVSNIYWYPSTNLMNNQVEFTGSFVYLLNETFSPSIGFIYMDRRYDDNPILGGINTNDVLITAGLVVKYDNLNIHFALMDGHIFSNYFRKQTIVESSISYNF